MFLRIRPSRPADGTRIVEIWCAAVDATHDFLAPADRAAIEDEVRTHLPGTPMWLAVDAADRPLAFMILDGGHMEALFVDPAMRSAGVGRRLVEHALTLTPALTTDVNAQNPQALGFYSRLGFVPIGRSETDGQGRPYPLIHLRLDPPTR
ncbi:acetyltransferase [Sphingomonas parva]|uniref:Acetyltransferase n=1 Tax=Sphingomonas parva TaxID=2555898 RepID=A0A4Y8ZUE8_9SPHN|nr:acetyltransferase [Sphingomonas parva]TFI59087.1 acetyltransferase [Sphingomonas parva]